MFEFIRNIFSIPFGYIIGFFYDISGNYLLSLLFMTLIVKIVLLPASIKQQKAMAKTQRMQPKIKRIREKYAGNQQKLNEAMNELYAKEGYSSMTGGCSTMLIQLPVMMGVYAVNYRLLSYVLKIPAGVISTLSEAVKALEGLSAYETQDFRLELTVISHWSEIDKSGLSEDIVNKISGFVDKFTLFGVPLEQTPNVHMGATLLWLIPILTGVVSLLMAVYTFIRQRKTNPEMAKNPSMGCMTFMSPAMSIWFSFLFPASVGVYIILSTFLSFVQMVILNQTHSPKKVLARLMVDETVNRRAREKVLKNVAKTLDDENRGGNDD